LKPPPIKHVAAVLRHTRARAARADDGREKKAPRTNDDQNEGGLDDQTGTATREASKRSRAPTGGRDERHESRAASPKND